ncbi:putative two-component system hybrid sensor and regulator [Selenomonas ruminantium subsp. lactilytica TAM6421]|uniref:histidine kinase n=1 Tax=Selenomonas ruminantium subsp. lactilytica (strain NBRC 103574 / TAM6421) TaxID=927704 RepID=I0GSM5_SELRL|nr:ATP-binding protein [Selenomonas ruminantium]BAL83762.1 putative two-component system hybrid sensor and regulator [Selenomonas ruminantium subsp. lactilytica TAM6421]
MLANYKNKFANIEDAFAPVLVCRRHADALEVLHISAGLCHTFKMSREALLHGLVMPASEIVHPDDLVRVLRYMQRSYLNPDEFQQFSYRMKLPGMVDYIWLLSVVYGQRLPDDTILQYITSLDITQERREHEQQEAKFEHTSALLEKILDTTQTALFWKDAERRFLGANKAFLDYYEFPSEKVIIGKNDEDMGWHKQEEPFKSDEWRVIHLGESTYRVHGQCMSHGEMRDIVASKSPLIENGKIVGLVGSFEDVTDEIRRQEQAERLNEQLQQALERAESANRAKTAFLSNVSHDMRTPLNGILGIAELASKTDDIEKMREYLQKIITAGSLLKDLINDTLELSRIGSGKKQLDLEVVEADRMLERLITAIRSSAEQKKVHFHIGLALAELGFVQVDRLKLSKVLLNLLSNAVKFTPEGGDVWLLGEVLSCDEHEGLCRFTVKDSGIGMSPEFIPKMFMPFEQENALSAQGVQGTGLGLSIAKELLTLMGGTIAVDSVQGKGTTFTVEVSFARVKGQRHENKDEVNEKINLDNRQVLVCEDNELNREIVTTILEMNHMQVVTAENGEEGIKRFVESPEYHIEAILMDIRMPVMDGLTAAARIRQLFRKDAGMVPIIALSANAFQEDVVASRQAGMNDHLTKPVEPDILLECLSRCIKAYESARKSAQP